jgi:hypothetical protein
MLRAKGIGSEKAPPGRCYGGRSRPGMPGPENGFFPNGPGSL